MTRQHVLIAGALVILLFIIGLPFMGEDEVPEQVPDSSQSSEPDLPSPEPEPEPDPEPMAESEPMLEPEPLLEPPESAPEQQASEPEPEPESEPEAEPLPPLNESDQFVTRQLREVDPPAPIIDSLASSQLVRKTVMLVDNMSRGEIPPRDRPLEGPSEEIQVRQIGNEERWIMEEASYRRFDGIVNAFTAMETEQVLALYDRVSPLLEEAYAELGYPDREFDETLLQAITRVLNASTPEGPFELTLPSVHYEFADERLESLSRVEKQLIRMGPENARKVKDKLREVRQALLARQQEDEDNDGLDE